jgi:hypothetical protein
MASLGTQKNWPLFESGCYPGADREKLLYTFAGWGLGRSLLTGGRCSEVAVNTGLTVLKKIQIIIVLQDLLSIFNTKSFCGQYKTGTGFSFADWSFFDGTTLSNCKQKNCQDGTGVTSDIVLVLLPMIIVNKSCLQE